MTTTTVTELGQITIPVEIQQKLGLSKGSRVQIIEAGESFVVKPLLDLELHRLAGILPGKGKALRALIKERQV